MELLQLFNTQLQVILVCTHLCLCLMPPPGGWSDVVTLAGQERVELVHAHSRHVEGRHMYVRAVRHPCLRHIGGVCPAAMKRKNCQYFELLIHHTTLT